MKKSLTDLLDTVSPEELDSFADELNAPAPPPEVLAAVKSRTYAGAGTPSGRRTGRIRFVLAAAVVCILLIAAAAAILVPMLRRDNPGTLPPVVSDSGTAPAVSDSGTLPDETAALPIIWVSPVLSDCPGCDNPAFIVGSSADAGGTANAPPAIQFYGGGFAVRVKVVQNYPDLYYRLDNNPKHRPTAYRLILMQTMEILVGCDVPQSFLYLIPEHLFVDMSVYDSLLISMSQLGAERYVLKNGTKNTMESVSLPVFCNREDHPELGSIIAFTGGVFDESLWQTPSWKYGYQFARYELEHPESSRLIVKRGSTEHDVISAIGRHPGQGPAVLTLSFAAPEAAEALAYTAPRENSVFAQRITNNGFGVVFVFTRFIGGCQTEETVTIAAETGEVTYSDVRYGEDDLHSLASPDLLTAVLAEKAAAYGKETPTPPHTDPAGKTLQSLHAYAWYVRADGKVYGVIRTSWLYLDNENRYLSYYDDAYTLVDPAAAAVADVTRDELVKLVGTRNVYTGQYGTVEEIPEE